LTGTHLKCKDGICITKWITENSKLLVIRFSHAQLGRIAITGIKGNSFCFNRAIRKFLNP